MATRNRVKSSRKARPFDLTKELLDIFSEARPEDIQNIYRFFSSGSFSRATKIVDERALLIEQGVDIVTATEAAMRKVALKGSTNKWLLSAWAVKHGYTVPIIDTVGSWIKLAETYGVDPSAKTVPQAKSRCPGIYVPITRKRKDTIDRKEKDEPNQDDAPPTTLGFTMVKMAFLEQMPNIAKSHFLGPEHAVPAQFDLESFTQWVTDACKRCQVVLRPQMLGKPAQFRTDGTIFIPEPRGFVDIHEWAAGIIHELSHAQHFLLEREAFLPGSNPASFSSATPKELHSYLEVIAEFSAGVAMYELGVHSPRQMQNSAAYVASYARNLSTPGGKALFNRALEISDKVQQGVLGPQVQREFDIDRYQRLRNGAKEYQEGVKILDEQGIDTSRLTNKQAGRKVLNYLSNSIAVESKPSDGRQLSQDPSI